MGKIQFTGMLEIKQFNKSQLLDYINSDDFRKGNDIPISLHRAISQTKNPRLLEEDILLLVAFSGDKMMGYLGILPDYFYLNKNESIKIGWLSCLWVSNQSRGKGVSTQLITKAVEIWNHKVLFADYVPATKIVYDKTNLFTNQPYIKKGIRLYIQSDLQHILPPKKEIFKKTKWAFKAIDFTLNFVLNIRLKFIKIDVSHLNFEYISQIDNEVNEFIINNQDKQLSRRSKDDLNWIINHPWILVANDKDEIKSKVLFLIYFKIIFL